MQTSSQSESRAHEMSVCNSSTLLVLYLAQKAACVIPAVDNHG